jgi:hypothetical protein
MDELHLAPSTSGELQRDREIDDFQLMLDEREARVAFPLPVHPHMRANAVCGYKPANDGQDTRAVGDYLGTRTCSRWCATPSCRRSGSSRSEEGRIDF